MTRRNQPSLSLADQSALRAVRILVAGCGSIGGATVVPLVRLGVERFVLCEPGDYELNNLNRQAADINDIGRNKAEVQADRARAINPEVEALVEPAGVTEDNVDWLVGTTDLVIDGVDVTEPAGIAAKRALHQEAWRQRRLVISGLDLGGTQVVYGFDYRDGRARPLNGRLDGVLDDIGALDRAARIAATAHGGQVVLSEAALQLAGPLPDGSSVRDLGFHRLKDIGAAERIYQLAGPGLRPDFPPLTPREWDAELAAGRALSQPGALALLRSLSPA
jgi:hypothetical protein